MKTTKELIEKALNENAGPEWQSVLKDIWVEPSHIKIDPESEYSYMGAMWDTRDGYTPLIVVYVDWGTRNEDEALQAADEVMTEYLMKDGNERLDDVGGDIEKWQDTWTGFAYKIPTKELIAALNGNERTKHFVADTE